MLEHCPLTPFRHHSLLVPSIAKHTFQGLPPLYGSRDQRGSNTMHGQLARVSLCFVWSLLFCFLKVVRVTFGFVDEELS